MSAVVFLDLSVDLSQIILLIAKVFLRMLHDKINDHHGNRQDQKRCQGHPDINGQHHKQYADNGSN